MPDSPARPYSGTAVLETMEEARNYTAYLTGLVLTAAGGARSVLDVGAGRGTMALALARAGYEVECVEPDDALRRHIAARGRPAHAALPVGRSYDFIYSLNVLEHIEDDDAHLRTLRGALRPGGRLLLYVPAFMCLYSAFDRMVGHHRRYTRPQLRDRLAAAGFTVDTIRYTDSLGFLAALVYRLIGPDDGTLSRRSLVAYDRLAFPLSRRLDRVVGPYVGKNLLAVARAP